MKCALNILLTILDYNDLHAFNFSSAALKVPSDQPREPINTEEAIRHILMRLQITKLEAPGQFDNQSMPVAHFTGKSRSVDVSWDPNANSKIRGSTFLTEQEARLTECRHCTTHQRWRSTLDHNLSLLWVSPTIPND